MIKISLPKNKKRVVIIGGGFAGLRLAQKLNKKKFQIVLIDKNNYHTFQPMLYQVATCGVEASAISFPLRKIFRREKDVHIRLCEAKEVIPEKNILSTSIGNISYDYLVIATGTKTNYFGNDELEDTTMTLKNTTDALYCRNKLLKSLERAQNTVDKELKAQLMTYVVVGGGPTGIELAGALAEMRNYILPDDYPDLDVKSIRIILLDAGDRLLATFSGKSSEQVYKALEKRGVDIRLNTHVKEYKNNIITYNESDNLASRNVFWVAGVTANNLKGLPKEVYGHAGRIIVNEYSQVQGYTNIFAIGDTAIMEIDDYPKGHPQVAQPAMQQGKLLARNLEMLENNGLLRAFHYFNKGNMATIGRNNAIVEIKKLHFSGFFGWISWLFIHLTYTIGVKNKLNIILDWMWAYFSYDPSLQLIIPANNKELEDPKDPLQTEMATNEI